MYEGSCLCGSVKYRINGEIKAVTNCHCRMCQKQHGAAFATYGSVPKSSFQYIQGEDSLAVYNSSKNIKRKFCKHCGSNIEWSGSDKFPDWVSIPLATLDTEFHPEKIREIYLESKCSWLT